MLPVNFEGAVVVGKPPGMTDEQCSSIYAKLHMISAGKNEQGEELFYPMWEEAWMPNREDIAAINRGEPIRIFITARHLPPIQIFTEDENKEQN